MPHHSYKLKGPKIPLPQFLSKIINGHGITPFSQGKEAKGPGATQKINLDKFDVYRGFLRTNIKAINLFIQMGDLLYGPITTIHQNGQITVTKIPWTASTLTNTDWEQVKDAGDILKVGHGYFILLIN